MCGSEAPNGAQQILLGVVRSRIQESASFAASIGKDRALGGFLPPTRLGWRDTAGPRVHQAWGCLSQIHCQQHDGHRFRVPHSVRKVSSPRFNPLRDSAEGLCRSDGSRGCLACVVKRPGDGTSARTSTNPAVVTLPAVAGPAVVTEPQALTYSDTDAWRSVATPVLSPSGQWLAS